MPAMPAMIAVVLLGGAASAASAADRPNIVFILMDDLGYGDFACYGATDVATPHIDRLAAAGAKLNAFYVSPVCSPTRASLMTGCYAQRVGIGGVLFERNTVGLNLDEITLPELLREQDYATALIGKWHLGYQADQYPIHHGFDEWFGTLSSNSAAFTTADKKFAADCVFRDGFRKEDARLGQNTACALMRHDEVVEIPADQNLLTRRYTEETIRFLAAHQNEPFFVYLAHNMPHIPLHASSDFRGRSKRGLYGDVIEELDWSVGQIMAALQRFDLDENTLVIVTSDNGPKLSAGGSAGGLRGEKGSTLEGGVRVPCLMQWPGHIPAGRVIDEPVGIIDMLPTLVGLAGGQPPTDRVIDGKDIRSVVTAGASSPHKALYYLRGSGTRGVRAGDWKLVMEERPQDKATNPVELTKAERRLPREQRKALLRERRSQAKPTTKARPFSALYNVRHDPQEQSNQFRSRPQIAAQLQLLLDMFQSEWKRNRRPVGQSQTAANN